MSQEIAVDKQEQNTIPDNEWDRQVCQHLGELWELAHSPEAVFYTPEETHALLQDRIDAAKAKQKSLRGLDFAV